jgi:hypothetical protein
MNLLLNLLSERREMRVFQKMPFGLGVGSNPGPLALHAPHALIERFWMLDKKISLSWKKDEASEFRKEKEQNDQNVYKR